jgi:hypothetical protein
MVSSWQQDVKHATRLVAYVARQSNVVTGAAIPTHPEQPLAPPPPSVLLSSTGVRPASSEIAPLPPAP